MVVTATVLIARANVPNFGVLEYYIGNTASAKATAHTKF